MKYTTDHFSQICLVSTQTYPLHRLQCKIVQDNFIFDINNFLSHLGEIQWTDDLLEDLGKSFSNVFKKLNSLIDKYAPMRKLSSKLWIANQGLDRSIRMSKIISTLIIHLKNYSVLIGYKGVHF